MTIKKLKKQLNLTNAKIAKMFGYKSEMSYNNSKEGKNRLEKGLVEFYEVVKGKKAMHRKKCMAFFIKYQIHYPQSKQLDRVLFCGSSKAIQILPRRASNVPDDGQYVLLSKKGE